MIAEYYKRLSKYCKLSHIQVNDEKTPDNASLKEEEMIKDVEGDKILKHVKDGMYVITLEIDGEMVSSEKLANKVNQLGIEGNSNVAFIIGGSLGLADKVKKRSNYKLSFSKMTFPHQLMKVIMLEQINRSFRINRGEPYHK